MPATANRKPFDPAAIELHGLEQHWGDLGALGFPPQLPSGTHTAMVKAIMAVAAADGELSDTERGFVLGRARMFGAPQRELDEAAKFDPRGARLEDLLKAVPPVAARSLLYESIVVARSDGFAEKERAAARRMAQRLGVEPGLVDAIEGHLEVEDAVRRARIRLVAPPR